MRVRPAGQQVDSTGEQSLREGVGVDADLVLVRAEAFRRRDPEAGCLGGDHVLERTALQPGEHRAVDRLRVLLAAEDEPGAGAGERLVRRGRDDVAVLDRVGVQPGGDEAREVGHVAPEEGADLVGDAAEHRRVDRTRIGGAAADDDLRPVLAGEGRHLRLVDDACLARDAVVDDRVEPPGEVDLEPVGQVPAVVEPQREDGVPRLEQPEVHGHVRLRPSVGLDVGVLRPEQRLRAVDRELLDLVDDLAAAVVPTARVPLRVLVREHRAGRLQHGGPREVLGGDQLDLAPLALGLPTDQGRDLGVVLREAPDPQSARGGRRRLPRA